MSTNAVVTDGLTQLGGLSQGERVLDTFVAPSTTFRDILRSQSWWLPALLLIVFSLAQGYVVQRQVGFAQVTANSIHNSPKREDAMNQLTPEQKAAQLAIGEKMSAVITYAFPFLMLIGVAIYALILWGSFNFLLGASTRYSQVYAVCMYASLPFILLTILVMVSLWFGGNPEAYNYNYPAGTSLGYFMSDSAPWLRALGGRLDIIQFWSLGLTVLGMAIVAKKTIMQSAWVVIGWWVIMTLVATGGAAFS